MRRLSREHIGEFLISFLPFVDAVFKSPSATYIDFAMHAQLRALVWLFTLFHTKSERRMLYRLFVHGSFAPSGSRQQVLAMIPGFWEKAAVVGSFRHATDGSGCFGIGLADTQSQVEGFLFYSDRLAEHWDRLDTIEFAGFARVQTTVLRSDGVSVEAFVYAIG